MAEPRFKHRSVLLFLIQLVEPLLLNTVFCVVFSQYRILWEKKNPCILRQEVTFNSFRIVLCSEALSTVMTLTRAKPSHDSQTSAHSAGEHRFSCGSTDSMAEITLRHLLCFDKFASFTGGRMAEDSIRLTSDLLEVYSSLRHTT